jgi:hypothetical protein
MTTFHFLGVVYFTTGTAYYLVQLHLLWMNRNKRSDRL